jgi:hypothetical protein
MIRYSAVIDKKYYEFEFDEPLIVGNGFVFDGGYYGIDSMIADSTNQSYFMLLTH